MRTCVLFLVVIVISIRSLAQVTFPYKGFNLMPVQNYYTDLGLNTYWDNGWKYLSTGPSVLLRLGEWNTKSDFIFQTAPVNALISSGIPAPLTEVMRICENGNVGIGTSTPQNKLAVNGSVYSKGYEVDGAIIANTGMWGLNATAIAFNVGAVERMRIDANGNMGIGTASPQAKLAVNGDLFAKRIKVTQIGWPDYVFEPAYILPTLQQLELFVKENKHLPEIPSANEIKQNGLDLGENQAKLLQKIEELTLYLIDLNKKVESQQKLILEQRKEIIELKGSH